jgi:hypothetical protein
MEEKPQGKGVSWRIPEDLRKRINTKAEWREQTAEEFVVECMEENTKELRKIQSQIADERKRGVKPKVLK